VKQPSGGRCAGRSARFDPNLGAALYRLPAAPRKQNQHGLTGWSTDSRQMRVCQPCSEDVGLRADRERGGPEGPVGLLERSADPERADGDADMVGAWAEPVARDCE
jgi:hypothetical protein